jgi:hypothetical protein
MTEIQNPKQKKVNLPTARREPVWNLEFEI